MKNVSPRRKPVSFIFLCIYLFSFTILEGFSNTYFAVGSIGLGGLVAIFWLLESFYLKSFRLNVGSVVLFVFVWWMFATVVWSYDPAVSLGHVFRLLLVLILYVMTFDIIRTNDDLLTAISAYLLGVSIVGVSGFVNVYTGTTYGDLSNRYSASGFDPNNFGLILASAIPLVFISLTKMSIHARVFGLLLIALFMFLIISAASRAGAVALAIVLIGLMVLRFDAKQLVRISFVGALVALVFHFFLSDLVPEMALNRLSMNAGDDAGGGRFDIWSAAVRSLSGSVLEGNGAGVSFSMLGDQAHNTFISALFEGGVIGLFFWVVFWCTHFWYAAVFTLRKQGIVGALLVLSLVPILIAAVTLNWEFRKPLFLVMAFIAIWYKLGSDQSVSSSVRAV